jgi:hypothetical protein
MKRLYIVNPVFYYTQSLQVEASSSTEALESIENYIASGLYNEDHELSLVGISNTGEWNVSRKKDVIKYLVESDFYKTEIIK